MTDRTKQLFRQMLEANEAMEISVRIAIHEGDDVDFKILMDEHKQYFSDWCQLLEKYVDLEMMINQLP